MIDRSWGRGRAWNRDHLVYSPSLYNFEKSSCSRSFSLLKKNCFAPSIGNIKSSIIQFILYYKMLNILCTIIKINSRCLKKIGSSQFVRHLKKMRAKFMYTLFCVSLTNQTFGSNNLQLRVFFLFCFNWKMWSKSLF